MIKQSSLNFLTQLKENNSKEWFEQNRGLYEEYRRDILQFTEELLRQLSAVDPAISLANLDPKKCLTRVNRDLRFSKDKTPYKNHVLIVFNKNGFHGNAAGYYLQIEPGSCYLGGGIWQTTPTFLNKIRQEIDYSYSDFFELITSPKFQKTFPNGVRGVGRLKKIPDGFKDSNPAAELLKMKGFCTKESIGDLILTSDKCLETVIHSFKMSKPLIDFVNKAIDFDHQVFLDRALSP